MATQLRSRKTRTLVVEGVSPQGVILTPQTVINTLESDGIVPADSGFEAMSVNPQGGVDSYLFDQGQNDTTINMKHVNSGSTSPPITATLTQACAFIQEETKVLDIQSSAALESGETLRITTVTGATLTATGGDAIGSSTISIDSDAAVTLRKNAQITVNGTQYTIQAEVVFSGAGTQVATISPVLDTSTTASDPITLNSNGVIGVVSGQHSNVYIDGDLVIASAASISDTTIEITLENASAYNCDIFALLPSGTQLSVGSNIVKLTSDLVFTANDETVTANVDALTAALVGAEVVTYKNTRVFFVDFETSPIDGDTFVSDINSTTGSVLAGSTSTAYVLKTSLPIDTQNYVNIDEYASGVKFRMSRGRANVTFAYASGALPTASYTYNGKLHQLVDEPSPDLEVLCDPSKTVNNAKLFLGGYDTHQLSLSDANFDAGNTVTADTTTNCQNGIREFFITDIVPKFTATLTAPTVAEWNPIAERTSSTQFDVVYIAGTLDDSINTRIAHIFPNAQHAAMPSRSDKDGFESYGLDIGAIVGCSTLPQHMIYFY